MALPVSAKQTDEEKCWVTAFQAGDPVAMRAIYERHRKPLCYFSFRITKDFHISEDIIQDIFLKLYELRSKFFFEGAVVRFLYVSAKNASINYDKHRKRYIDVAVNEALQEKELELDTFREMIRAETKYEVYEMLKLLPREQQEILWASVVDGQSAEEIARKMNLTVSNVRTKKHRSLIVLQAYAIYQRFTAKLMAPTMLIIYLLWKALEETPIKI